MKNPTVVEFISLEHIKEKWETYKELLLQEGLFVLRNANFSVEEQKQLQFFIGTSLNCWPSENSLSNMQYTETHQRAQETIIANKDQILLNWHIEHAEFDNSMVLGLWNMEVFTTQPENGNTVFVNTTELYKNLPIEDQEFLKSSIAVFPAQMVSEDIPLKQDPLIQNNLLTGPFIREHWVTKEPIVRISFWSPQWLSHMINRETKEEDKSNFKRLFDYFWKEVKKNKGNWIVQEWQQGDLLIVDLQKMAHAVLGGFHFTERKLQGLFSFEKSLHLFPEIDLDSRKK